MTTNFGYLGNPRVLRDGIQWQYTQQEYDEYVRCANDPVYFAEHYVKVIHVDHGLMNYKPYPYQRKMIENFEKNRFNIVLSCRQSGKSVSSLAYLLWVGLFRPDQMILVLANKGSTARELFGRMSLMLENVPFFLQPGCKTLNKGSVEFSNNSRIEAHASGANSVRGKSASLVYLDEFAFVERAEEFYTSTYPVISSGKKSRVIITSTLNTISDMFYKLWENAVQGVNEYHPFRVDWWDVPGRDEAWKNQAIANTSEEQFNREFGNELVNDGKSLINQTTLLTLKAHSPVDRMGDTLIYKRPEPGNQYVIAADVSKGRGQDFSAFSVIDVTQTPFKQVATYRNNLVSPLIYPDIIYKMAKAYNDAYIIVEANDQGSLVYKTLYYDYEYDNMYSGTVRSGKSMGLEMTAKVKGLGCSNLKDLVEQNKLQVVDADTIKELCTFHAKGGSWAATSGNHDDTVMALVCFSWFLTTNAFGYMSDETLRAMMNEERERLIEASVPFFGVMAENPEKEVVAEMDHRDGTHSKFIKDDTFGWITEEVGGMHHYDRWSR